jgi:hemoglobin
MSKNSITTLSAVCSIAIMFAQPVMAESLYQDFGEKAGLTKMVHEFIGVVASDNRINSFFKNTNIERLQEQLVDQMCAATGGDCKYTGGDMKTIHGAMGVNTANFNALVEDLQVAMNKQGISSSAQNKLLAKLAPMQRDIVTK